VPARSNSSLRLKQPMESIQIRYEGLTISFFDFLNIMVDHLRLHFVFNFIVLIMKYAVIVGLAASQQSCY